MGPIAVVRGQSLDWPDGMNAPDLPDRLRSLWISCEWGNAADGLAAAIELSILRGRLVSAIDSLLVDLDLSLARYEILMVLYFAESRQMSISKLGRRLQVHSTSVTSAVDRLEGSEYVTRVRGYRDRREVYAVLTSKGLRVALEATEILNSQVFSQPALARENGGRIWALLKAMRANAGDFSAHRPKTRFEGPSRGR